MSIQAEDWVRHRMSERKAFKGYVCEYEFDETALRSMDTLVFEALTDEWVDFVMMNRTPKGYVHKYDFVYAPLALYQNFKSER